MKTLTRTDKHRAAPGPGRRLIGALALALAACVGGGLSPASAAVLVNLDATGQSPGPLATWSNSGTMADFTSAGTATPNVVTVDGVNAVQFVGGTPPAEGTHYVGPISPLFGDASRTVEVWVHDSEVQDYKTLVTWGHRGGPDGSNVAFGHGTHPTWGAVGLWGGPDIDWAEQITFGEWNYIAFTYDQASREVAVYSNGAQAKSKILANPLATHQSYSPEGTIAFRIARETDAAGAITGDGMGNSFVARVRIHDVALDAAAIQSSFDSEASFFGLEDVDGDGMPAWFEGRYAFLSDNNAADANLDEDSDGLTNKEEFDLGTEVDNPDTDEDGLKDGVETMTGTWVSADDTGTDPFDPDADNDGVLDGAETNTGTFVNANDAGTDPFNTDSDGDTFDDGGEIANGTDPTNPDSKPEPGTWVEEIANSAPLYWYRFETSSVLDYVENEGSLGGDTGYFWGLYGSGMADADLGKASVHPDLGHAVEFTGPAAGNDTQKFLDIGFDDPAGNNFIPELTNFRPPTVDKTTTVEYWIRTSHRGSSGDQTWNSPSVLGHESPGDGDMYWGWFHGDGRLGFSTSDIREIYAGGITDGTWHHIVMIKEWHVAQQCVSTLYVDGGEAQGGQTIVATTAAGNASYQDTDSGIRYLGFTQNGGSGNLQFIGLVDEVAIYDRALTATEARLHYLAAGGSDTDGDGMPDAWELQYGLNPNDPNDAGLDKDSDGSTNLNEFQSRTNPENPDTDDDGLMDGPETNTGVWVSASDRGCDPLDSDSDDDGLLDGVETNTGVNVDENDRGTDPNKLDTDEDLYKDGDEIELGSDPSDANSTPTEHATWAGAIAADAPLYWWQFNSTSVGAGVPNDGSVSGFDGTFGSGVTNADLGKASATAELGTALELTGPPAGTIGSAINPTTKFVNFGAPIPELINLRSAPVEGQTTTVEYWINTTHTGTVGDQTWNSPAIFSRESGGQGDMYWGWINEDGQFGFSSSDIMEINADGVVDGQWHHVVMSKYWSTNEPCISRMYIDGGALSGGQTIVAATGPGQVQNEDQNYQDDDAIIQYLGFTETGGAGGGDNPNVQYIGLIDEVAIYSKTFNEAMARVHFLASGYVVTPPSFDITDVSIDEGTGAVSLTWESAAGADYTIERAGSLPATWTEVGQVTADAATATFEDRNPPAGAAFYRVMRQ